MTPQRELIDTVSQGILSSLVGIAYKKRLLNQSDTSVGDRLEILRSLAGDKYFTSQVIEAVEPASDGLAEAFKKAWRASDPNDRESFFSLIERPDVFANLCKLHPSLLTALEVHGAGKRMLHQ
jgi:hypothetical protein